MPYFKKLNILANIIIGYKEFQLQRNFKLYWQKTVDAMLQGFNSKKPNFHCVQAVGLYREKKINNIIICVGHFCMTTGNVQRFAADSSSHSLHVVPKYLGDSHLA